MRPPRTSRGLPALLLLLLTAAAGCAAPQTSLIARGGVFIVDGSIGAAQGPLSGGASADALGLDSAGAFQPRVDVDWDDWHLSANGLDVEVEGSGVADARLEWNGNVLQRGIPADSRLAVRLVTADFAWDPIPWDFMDIGIGAGIGALQLEAAIRAQNLPIEVLFEKETPMGYLLLRLAKKTPDWGVVFRAAGISASFENDDVTYYEFDLMGNLRLVGSADGLHGDLIAGWRYLHAEYVYTSADYRFETDPTLQGPYVGVALVF